jgi:hypothetical protein
MHSTSLATTLSELPVIVNSEALTNQEVERQIILK